MEAMNTPIPPDTRPDYHFLLIAPSLGAAWFFEAARAYYEAFLPTVVSDGGLIQLVPDDKTIAVSILTRRDSFQRMAVQASARPDVLIDALVYDTAEEAAATLNIRAANFQPFGVPLRPTAVPPTQVPLTPTSGAIIGGPPTATPNMSGFVTQVPTATSAPSNLITQTPAPNADDGPAINPTPGAIIGNDGGE